MEIEKLDFQALYGGLTSPVVVCDTGSSDFTVVFMNEAARSALSYRDEGKDKLFRIFPIKEKMQQKAFLQKMESKEPIKDWAVKVETHIGTVIPVVVNANRICLGGEAFLLLTFGREEKENTESCQNSLKIQNVLFDILCAIHYTVDIDLSIQRVLSLLGRCLDVSRVYIFEETGRGTVSNTYEWCGEGVCLEIKNLQEISHGTFGREEIMVKGGKFSVDDIRELNEADWRILEPQGIKSLFILPLYDKEFPLGFVGVDECRYHRKWNNYEENLLQGVTSILSSLLGRKRIEQKVKNSLQVLRKVLNNMDALIYVSDIETYQILFANEKLKEVFQDNEIEGKICWQALQRGQGGPCDFCPVKKLQRTKPNGEITYEPGILRSEIKSTRDHRWYYISDCIIQWLDGRKAHLESAVEFTERKKAEEQLELHASRDMLTGIYNRKWGYQLLERELEYIEKQGLYMSLCFVDIDNLKLVNDTYGHSSGDVLLKEIVSVMKGGIRDSDIFFRWGGDEFILVLERCHYPSACSILEKIEKELDKINSLRKYPFELSFSYGIEEFRAGSHGTLEAMIELVDAKMYQNKMKKKRLTLPYEYDIEK